MRVIDLGAAPGSWSQVSSNIVVPKITEKVGKVIAVDILPIEPIKNVDIINGDFANKLVFEQICSLIETNSIDGNKKVDVILSDMAPNLSGIWAIDIHKAMNLFYIALYLVKRLLKPNGSFLVKLFHGDGFEEYLTMLRQYFAKVIIFKPKSSRVESREVYAFANNFLTGSSSNGKILKGHFNE